MAPRRRLWRRSTNFISESLVYYILLIFMMLMIDGVDCFSTGAAGCAGDGPAVGSLHIFNSNKITGELSDGGLVLSLDGIPLDPDKPIDITTNVEYSIILSTDTFYRGLLFRLEPTGGESIDGALRTDESNLQEAFVCQFEDGDVVGITHTNPLEKKESKITLKLPEPISGLKFDMTVVRENRVLSEYYYSGFTINAVSDVGGKGAAKKQPVESTPTPSNLPTLIPSSIDDDPSSVPTTWPSGEPTLEPSITPSSSPTLGPAPDPTAVPSSLPTNWPTGDPTTAIPSSFPTMWPVVEESTVLPSLFPTVRTTDEQTTSFPTELPINAPTLEPTLTPSSYPTMWPVGEPTMFPSNYPTTPPTAALSPTKGPTLEPTSTSSSYPTMWPAGEPTMLPSSYPTTPPTTSLSPTKARTLQPTLTPSSYPTMWPAGEPTMSPSSYPTTPPTAAIYPTGWPIFNPTLPPSSYRTTPPTSAPSPTDWPEERDPTISPSSYPTIPPTSAPFLTDWPEVRAPTVSPSSYPMSQPSSAPSFELILSDKGFDSDPEGCEFVVDMFVDGDDEYVIGLHSPDKGRPDVSTKDPTGGLIVWLGGVDDSARRNMSGGWRCSLSTSQPMHITLQFDYQVLWSSWYDDGDESRILCGLDSVITFDVDSYNSSSPRGRTEWKTAIVDVGEISPGTHYLEMGGVNNRKDQTGERTNIYFDNLLVYGTGVVAKRDDSTPQPTTIPTVQPSSFPTDWPVKEPTLTPTSTPSSFQTDWQISDPTLEPTKPPSSYPTEWPLTEPSSLPSTFPTTQPSSAPSFNLVLIDKSFEDDSEGCLLVKDMFVEGDDEYALGSFHAKRGRPDETGSAAGGGLALWLGGLDNTFGFNMSAGWRCSFTTALPIRLTIQFDYQVLWPTSYDEGEETSINCGIDGEIKYTVETFDESSSRGWSEWKTTMIDVGEIAAGSHNLDVGGVNNRKDQSDEKTYIYLDNIVAFGNGVAPKPTSAPTGSVPPSRSPSTIASLTPTTPPTSWFPLKNVLLNTTFDGASGKSGFKFLEDIFIDGDDGYALGYFVSGAGKPDELSGQPTAGIFVRLGGYDSGIGYNISAGWRYQFSTTRDDMMITVEFDYQAMWSGSIVEVEHRIY